MLLWPVETDERYVEAGAFTLDWTFRYDGACISAVAGPPVTEAEVPTFCDAFREEFLTEQEDGTTAMLTCQVADGVCLCDGAQTTRVDTRGTFQRTDTMLLFDDG